MEIATSQVSNWRRVLAFGFEIVDITAKSGISCFAPNYADVMEYKSGRLDQEEYTAIYIDKMRRSFVENRQAWDNLKKKDKVAYVCYCRPGEFCHRHIFVDLLSKFLDREGVKYERIGEIS